MCNKTKYGDCPLNAVPEAGIITRTGYISPAGPITPVPDMVGHDIDRCINKTSVTASYRLTSVGTTINSDLFNRLDL